jgi:L,D-transpeptidase ErfK/SrfK
MSLSHLIRYGRGFMVLASVLGASFVQAAAYSLPDQSVSVVGAVTSVRAAYEDTLASLAERHGLGFRELVRANPEVDPWLPGEGTEIILPTQYVLPSAPREGIVINVAEFRLYYYPPNRDMVIVYPVGLGRQDFRTPLTKTRIRTAIANPAWTPTATSRREYAARGKILPPVVMPGPDNPMGSWALQLDIPSYFIHGTNEPFGVGQMASQGCIRLYEPHIATLAELVSRGTPVAIVNEPYKIGRRGDQVFVQVHEEIYGEQEPGVLAQRVRKAVAEVAKKLDVDWALLGEHLERPTGVPVLINAGASIASATAY